MRLLYIPGEKDLGGEEVFFSKMYCFREQSEAVFGVFFYYYFPWSFWSALSLLFSASTSSFPRLPWLRSRKRDWALLPDIQRNIKVRGNGVFCFASWLGFTDPRWEGTCSQTGSGVTLGSSWAIGQGITESWSLREFLWCLVCSVGCMTVGLWGIVTNVFCSGWRAT